MKKLIFCVFILLSLKNVNAQYLIAGQQNEIDYFFDIIPDTSIIVYISGHSSNGAYDIDINGDGVADFIIKDYISSALGGGIETSQIEPLNGNEIALAYYDSCFGNPNVYPPPSFVAKNPMARAFNINDTINTHSYWTDSLAFMRYRKWIGNQYFCGDATFDSFSSRYLGVRCFSLTDTIYGWIKIKINPVIIEEFACRVFFDYNLHGSIILYPNPANTEITIKKIQASGESTLTILSFNGMELLSQNFNNSVTHIDISQLKAGIYFCKYVSAEAIEIRKFIVK